MTTTTTNHTLGDLLRENIGRKDAAERIAAQEQEERARATRVENFRKDLGQARAYLTAAVKNGVASPVVVIDEDTTLYRELDSLVAIRYPGGKVLFQAEHPLLETWFEFLNWAKAEKLGLMLKQFIHEPKNGEEIDSQFAIGLVLPEAVEES